MTSYRSRLPLLDWQPMRVVTVPLHPAREPSPDLRLPAEALTLTAARLVALETHPQDSILALVQAGLHPNSGPAENQGCDANTTVQERRHHVCSLPSPFIAHYVLHKGLC
jgi:hypothetical protein